MSEKNKTVIARARDVYPGEFDSVEQIEPLPYKERVIARIRAVYSVDDEIAIIRQRDTKPKEFQEYHSFVEKIKAEEKER